MVGRVAAAKVLTAVSVPFAAYSLNNEADWSLTAPCSCVYFASKALPSGADFRSASICLYLSSHDWSKCMSDVAFWMAAIMSWRSFMPSLRIFCAAFLVSGDLDWASATCEAAMPNSLAR